MPKRAATILTDQLVRKLKPKTGSRVEVRDASVRGLGLRVTDTGIRTWFVMARARGRQFRETLGYYPAMSLAEARQAASGALQGLRNGQRPQTTSRLTFASLMDLWLTQDQANNKSYKDVKRAMERDVRPHLATAPIETITTRDASDALCRARAGRSSGPHDNRLLSYTKRLFAWAVEQGHLQSNPALSIRKPASERSRDRVLTLPELAKLWRAAETLGYPFGPFFQLLLLTGQRRNEVAGMDWSEIDLKSGEWKLPAGRTKNGRSHLVHLAPLAVTILSKIHEEFESQGKPRSGPVFSTRDGRPVSGFSKAKKRLDKAAGFSDWHVHDLRRSFATHSDEHLKADYKVIEWCLNHVSGTRAGVIGAYNRAEKLPERHQLMIDWDNLIDRLSSRGQDSPPLKVMALATVSENLEASDHGSHLRPATAAEGGSNNVPSARNLS